MFFLVEFNWNEMRSLKDPSAHILLSNGRQIWVCPIKSCKIMGIICGKEIQLQFPIVIYLPVFRKTILSNCILLNWKSIKEAYTSSKVWETLRIDFHKQVSWEAKPIF